MHFTKIVCSAVAVLIVAGSSPAWAQKPPCVKYLCQTAISQGVNGEEVSFPGFGETEMDAMADAVKYCKQAQSNQPDLDCGIVSCQEWHPPGTDALPFCKDAWTDKP